MGEKGETTRRSVLKSAGFAVGAASMGLVGTTRAYDHSENALRIKRSYKNPISLDHLRETRQRALQKHGQDKGDLRTFGKPIVPDDGAIIDYVVTVLPNGNPSQHVGIAGSSVAEEIVHSTANQREAELKRTSEISLQDYSGWTRLNTDTSSYTNRPYGQVVCNYTLYKLSESRDDNGQDLFGIKGVMAMTPGTDLWNQNLWRNYYGVMNHNWFKGTYDNYGLVEWDPLSTNANVVDVTLSTSPPLSWSFNNDVHIDVHVNASKPRVKWEIDGIYGKNHNRTQGQEPGSSCEVPGISSGESRRLLNMSSVGYFEKQIDKYTTKRARMKSGWSIGVSK